MPSWSRFSSSDSPSAPLMVKLALFGMRSVGWPVSRTPLDARAGTPVDQPVAQPRDVRHARSRARAYASSSASAMPTM